MVVESHTFAADISPSAWNHIALSKAGTDLHYWRNGVLVETASAVVSDPLPDNPAMPLRFGTNWTNTAFYGVMDCIGKWPRKLVDAEVRGLFNNGNGKEPTF